MLRGRDETIMQRVDFILRKISDIFGYAALFALIFLMMGTTIDVILRNLFDISLLGVFELSELAMVLVVCLGLGWTFIDDGHIRVSLLVEKLSPRTTLLANAVAGFVVTVFLFFLAYPSTIEAIRSTSIQEFRWGVVEIPIWWAKIILSICLWFTFLQFLFGSINSMGAFIMFKSNKSGKA